MTDLRQAAQQALEALEGWEHCDKWVWPVSALEQAKRNTTESLAALRTALEQQAEPTPWRDMVVVTLVREGINKHKARELADHFAAQQAEPVQERITRIAWDERGVRTVNGIPDDAPQRPWVGLTDDEIDDIYWGAGKHDLLDARAIEAKLKERNT